jgi:type IV pilus assembly protein PilO
MNIRQPRNQKLILTGIGVAAISYLYFFSTFVPFGHRRAAAEKAELEQSYKQLSADLSKARQSLNNLEEVERQYQVITSRWEVASELLPGEREVANLLRKVTLVGQQAGVNFVLFKPKSQIPGEIYTENPVEVKVVGSYHQVGSFLAEVANLDRIVNVTGLSLGCLKNGTETETVEANCLATAYTMNPVPETPATGSNKAETPAKTPEEPNQAESKGAKHEG